MRNLAPGIFRQRLVIEGRCSQKITGESIKEYLFKLSKTIKMKSLIKPVTGFSRFGPCGWIHWETSGCHFYAWDKPSPFFSSDIYTCKKFDIKAAVEFTRDFFKATELVYKEV